MAWTPDGRMLLAIKEGQILVYQNGIILPNPAIDISSHVCADDAMGIGGISVNPNFTANHHIYLYYNYPKYGSCTPSNADGPVDRLSRFVLNVNNTINPGSETVLLDSEPLTLADHNGGDVEFGHDGLLYVSTGDGGTQGAASQNMSSLLGKILRVTDDGTIPPGNPFTGTGTSRCNIDGVPPNGSPDGTICEEVYASGLRNPWRMAFDPNAATTNFYINDVGESNWEEIDQGMAGANYGWPSREGPCQTGSYTNCPLPPPGLTDPIAYYGHDVTVNGNYCVAITAGAFVPEGLWPYPYNSSYLFADWGCGEMWALVPGPQGGYSLQPLATLDTYGPVRMRFGPTGPTQALYYVTTAKNHELHRIELSTPQFDKALVSVGRAADNELYWSSYSTRLGSWAPWQILSGATSATPTLCSSVEGAELIVRGMDSHTIYHRRFVKGTWSGSWDTPGGATQDQPACAVLNGTLYLVVRGTDDEVWFNSQPLNSSVWSSWVRLGGQTLAPPALTVSTGANRLDLVVRGMDDVIYHKSYLNGQWATTWDSPGGNTARTPVAVSDSAGLHLILVAENDVLYYNHLTFGGTWSGWTYLAGDSHSTPSLSLDNTGTLNLVARGLNDNVYHKPMSPGGQWQSYWDSSNGSTPLAPASVAVDNRLYALLTGGSEGMFFNQYYGSYWTGWTPLSVPTVSTPAIITES